MAKSDFDALLRELPHILVLVILLLVLLVVLTKFQVVHCSQIPGNWCDIYCNQIMRTHSRVALISGDGGIGDPGSLENLIRRTRVYTYVEPFPVSALSSGMLNRYDLVILERMKRISTRQSQAIEDFVNRGGTMIWVGDAASERYVDPYDLTYARTQNQSFYESLLVRNVTPGTAEWDDAWKSVEETQWYNYLIDGNRTFTGFGGLTRVVAAEYEKTENSTGNLSLNGILLDHLIMRGIVGQYPINDVRQFAVVNADPSVVSMIATLSQDGREYPAIFEAKYAGRIIYFAFPLETSNSTTLVTNVVDYLVPC